MGGRDCRDGRTWPDRGRHHSRCRRSGAEGAAGRRRIDRRDHSGPFLAPRHDDAGDQSPAGDGAARRDGAAQPQRDRARPVGSARQERDRAAAGAAARNEADVRGRGARTSGPADRRRRSLQARSQNHGSARIGRRRTCSARVRQVALADGPDQHDDSRGTRPDRTASDGARAESGGRGRGARPRGRGAVRRAG